MEGIDAAGRGNDGELTAPHGYRFGSAIEEALIRVERELVKRDVATFASEGVRIGGKGINAAAVGEFDDVGGGFGFAVEEDFAAVGESDFHKLCPVTAIIELNAGLGLVARGDEGVEASTFGAYKDDQAIAVAPGEAGLAGFDADFQGRIVFDPEALGFVEEFGWGTHFYLPRMNTDGHGWEGPAGIWGWTWHF